MSTLAQIRSLAIALLIYYALTHQLAFSQADLAASLNAEEDQEELLTAEQLQEAAHDLINAAEAGPLYRIEMLVFTYVEPSTRSQEYFTLSPDLDWPKALWRIYPDDKAAANSPDTEVAQKIRAYWHTLGGSYAAVLADYPDAFKPLGIDRYSPRPSLALAKQIAKQIAKNPHIAAPPKDLLHSRDGAFMRHSQVRHYSSYILDNLHGLTYQQLQPVRQSRRILNLSSLSLLNLPLYPPTGKPQPVSLTFQFDSAGIYWQKKPSEPKLVQAENAAEGAFLESPLESPLEESLATVSTDINELGELDLEAVDTEAVEPEDADLIVAEQEESVPLFTAIPFDRNWESVSDFLRLERYEDTHVVALLSWVQPTTTKPVTPAIYFRSERRENRSDLLSSSAHPIAAKPDSAFFEENVSPPTIEGYVRLWKKRYLHLDVQMLLRERLPLSDFDDDLLAHYDAGPYNSASAAWIDTQDSWRWRPRSHWDKFKFWQKERVIVKPDESADYVSGIEALALEYDEIEGETSQENSSADASGLAADNASASSPKKWLLDHSFHRKFWNNPQLKEELLKAHSFDAVTHQVLTESFLLDGSLKVELEQLHFFDHPKFGVFLWVSPLEVSADESAESSE